MASKTTSIATPTAHLVGPGKLKVTNGRLAFSTGKGTPLRLDPEQLETVLCYGRVGVTDDAMRMLFHHEVQVAWLSAGGYRCRGRLVGFTKTATTLRMLQHQVLSSRAARLKLAQHVVAGKIESQLRAARHYQRHGGAGASRAMRRLEARARQCRNCSDVESLRGIEGAASCTWFTLMAKLLNKPWGFERRIRRPPTDPVNALLSLGYTFLLNRTLARCEAAGLEVNLGALHEYRPGRPSLACDLIEPLRADVVDRWIVQLCNQRTLAPEQFTTHNGGVRLQRDRFGPFLEWWEERWLDQKFDQLVEQSVDEFARQIRRFAREG